MAEIGQHSETSALCRDAESHRIGGIVWNRKGPDGKIPEIKSGAILKKSPALMGEPAIPQRARGEGVAINRHPVPGQQHLQSTGVIPVFVGEKNAGKLRDG